MKRITSPAVGCMVIALLLLLSAPAYALEPCCNIREVNSETGVVTAVRHADGQLVQLQIDDKALLGKMKVGQPIDMDHEAGTVSITVQVPVRNMKAVASSAAGAAPARAGRDLKQDARVRPGTEAADSGRAVTSEEYIGETEKNLDSGPSAPTKMPAGAEADPSTPGENRAPPPPDGIADGKTPQVNPAAPCCQVVPNPQLKGRLGRLVVAFPEDAKVSETRIDVYKPGEDKSITGAYGELHTELLPGKYDVVISGKRVKNVEVEPRHDTQMYVGVLRINAGAEIRFDLLTEDKQKLTGDYGSKDIGLPIGKVNVQLAGQSEPVTIEQGKITDF